MFGDAYDYIAEKSANAYSTVQMSQNEYLEQVNGFATGLKTALGGDAQAAAELADKIITAEADIVAATGKTAENVQNAFNGIMKSEYNMLDNLQIGITPTKKGMQEVIDKVNEWNTAQGKATDYTIDNVADVQSALVDYIDMVGMSGYASAEASKTISGSVASMSAAWSNLVTGVADDNADFAQLITNFVDSAVVAGENLLPRIEIVISGMGQLIETLFPTIVDRIPAIVNNVFPDLLQSGINMVLALVKGIQENFPEILKAGGEILLNLIDGIASILPSLLFMAGSIIGELYNAFVENFPVLLNTGYEMLSNLINGFVDAIPEMLPQALTFIQQLGESIAEKAPEFIQKGFELLGKLVEGILSALPILIENVPTIISTFANIVNDNFPTILAKGVELLIQFIMGIIQTIPTLIENVPQIIRAIVDTIMAFQWLDLGKNIMTFFKNGIMNMVGAIKTAGNTVFNTIKNAISNLPTTLFNIGKNGISGLKNAITGMIGTVRNAANLIFNAIVNIISTLPQKMVSIGSNIISGIWNGISSGWGWLVDKVWSLAESLLNAAKSALGIHSPSKEFAAIGQMCVAGWEEGTEDLMNPQDMTRNINASLSAMEMKVKGTAIGNNGTTSTFNQTINVNQQISTPDELARAVRVESRYGLMRGIAFG